MYFSELFCGRIPHSALTRDTSVGPLNMHIYRISDAGTKWGADALARSNYAALEAEFKDWLWCVVNPEDGPLYIPGHLSSDGWGHYDDTPPWDNCFSRAALVFHDGEVYVNMDYEFDKDGDSTGLLALTDTLFALDSYPIIDEMAFSELEYEEAVESMAELARWDLPKKIKALHLFAEDAIDLDPDFEITVDDILAACRTLGIQWETYSNSDGSAYASFTNDDLDRLAEHLAPPRLMAAADGLEWRDLGYPGKE